MKKKLNLCGICGVNFATKKHQLHGSVQSSDHQKSILLSKEDDVALLRSEMNFTKKYMLCIDCPTVSLCKVLHPKFRLKII